MSGSLYLSPHLDDVGISCVASILRDQAQGRRVTVATLFSKGAPDEARRKREDRLAMSRLGAEPVWLDFPDAPWKDPRYCSFRAIVLGRDRKDRGLLRELRALLELVSPDRIYAPLGVGTHVDHRAAHDVARRLGRPLVFYEDRPYAFLRHSVAMRLSELDARVATPLERPDANSFLECLDRTPFIRAYMGQSERGRCVGMMLRRLSRAARWKGRGRGPRLKAEVIVGDLGAAERVAAAYRSQAKDLFAGNFRGCALDYSRSLGVKGYVERQWWPA